MRHNKINPLDISKDRGLRAPETDNPGYYI